MKKQVTEETIKFLSLEDIAYLIQDQNPNLTIRDALKIAEYMSAVDIVEMLQHGS